MIEKWFVFLSFLSFGINDIGNDLFIEEKNYILVRRIGMGSKSKFWNYVIIGAFAGGVVSLLDRETRQIVGGKCNKATKNISYALTHPKEVVTNIKEKTNDFRIAANQLNEDISYIIDKIEEVRDLTPEVTGLILETKDAFIKDKPSKDKHLR